MDKILANAKCKLAKDTFATFYENVYGIRCSHNIQKWLHLFLWAYEQPCFDETIDCKHCQDVECLHCNLQATIGKMIKHCKDCKPKKYMEPIVTFADDYTDWYNSEEYLECLRIELEENGYIEPMVDLCKNLNIEISVRDACNILATTLAAEQVNCFMITDLEVAAACSTIVSNMVAEGLCKDFPTDLN
jgi:transcription elongation factor Elf1